MRATLGSVVKNKAVNSFHIANFHKIFPEYVLAKVSNFPYILASNICEEDCSRDKFYRTCENERSLKKELSHRPYEKYRKRGIPWLAPRWESQSLSPVSLQARNHSAGVAVGPNKREQRIRILEWDQAELWMRSSRSCGWDLAELWMRASRVVDEIYSQFVDEI